MWDSCFIAIGLTHVNPQRAAQELLSLKRGQWSNGMLPHMIYNPRLPYRLEAIFWGTGALSPKGGAKTSGMTQPPMLAIAAEKVAHALPPDESQTFVREILPTITKFHQWIYRERDPQNTGLAACLHSWESGLDDTPYWTEAMNHLPKPPLQWRWLREFRKVDASERAMAGDVSRMLALAHTLKRYRYDSAQIMAHSEVVIQDLVFNSILATANESLTRLAELVNQELPAGLHQWFAATRRAIEGLWDIPTSQYYSRHYYTKELLRIPTIATVMPLFAGTASPTRAQEVCELLSRGGFNTEYPLPTVPSTSSYFEARRYWRGPVWINMNWFAIAGLQRYGFAAEAQKLRQRTLQLAAASEFREYYNPLTGEGLGAENFSWSAALVLDLLSQK